MMARALCAAVPPCGVLPPARAALPELCAATIAAVLARSLPAQAGRRDDGATLPIALPFRTGAELPELGPAMAAVLERPGPSWSRDDGAALPFAPPLAYALLCQLCILRSDVHYVACAVCTIQFPIIFASDESLPNSNWASAESWRTIRIFEIHMLRHAGALVLIGCKPVP